MSNIYVQEPSTSGKVCLRTSFGDVDIELWAKECPKACRNFVQLCMEGYYDQTIFHRVVKNFIAQAGDPTGTGMGGDSIYGAPFKDEFHSRLRFVRRGLVAMANAGRNDNTSQFFLTLGATPELNGKHTIFGKVVGDTLYNILKLNDITLDQNEKPVDPPKIYRTEVVINPFDDIIPRKTRKSEADPKLKEKKESKSKATKNFNLLSFGDEAEEEDMELSQVTAKGKKKSKSAHDALSDVDPKLSAAPAVNRDELANDVKDGVSSPSADNEGFGEEEGVGAVEKERLRSRVKDKLRMSTIASKSVDDGPVSNKIHSDDEDLHEMVLTAEEAAEKKQVEALANEYRNLKKEFKEALRKKKEAAETPKEEVVSDVRKAYREEIAHFHNNTKSQPKAKTADREQMTLNMLETFKDRLLNAKLRNQGGSSLHAEKVVPTSATESRDSFQKADGKVLANNDKEGDNKAEDKRKKASEATWSEKIDVEDEKGEDWMAHAFVPEAGSVLHEAVDANTRTDEQYDIFDPRNAMNKRRRQEQQQTAGDDGRSEPKNRRLKDK